MSHKVVLVVGAGATLCDSLNKTLELRPPLDKEFFSECAKLAYHEHVPIVNYLKCTYDFNPIDPLHDSLEAIMAIVYADIHNPSLEHKALSSFRSLIGLFSRRVARSTNNLNPTIKSSLYLILTKLLEEGINSSDISIVTFNQDIQKRVGRGQALHAVILLFFRNSWLTPFYFSDCRET